MPRRVLTACTMMYIAGVTAGYFVFERMRTAESCCFITASCAAVMLAGRDNLRDRRQRLVPAALILAGFMSFALQYALFEAETSSWAGREDVLCGRVISAAVKEDRIDLVVRPERGSGMPRKVRLTLGDYSLHPATDESGDKKYPRAYELTGAYIKAGGEYREPAGADDPGVFDQRIYHRAKGMAVTFRANGMDVIDEGGVIASFRRYLFSTREEFISRFDDETAGFIRGTVFGDKRDLDEDIVKEFNANSTGHILAVSGLHMGFLYALLRTLSGKRKTAGISVAIIALMIIYGEMTLWSPATIRACIVMSISLLTSIPSPSILRVDRISLRSRSQMESRSLNLMIRQEKDMNSRAGNRASRGKCPHRISHARPSRARYTLSIRYTSIPWEAAWKIRIRSQPMKVLSLQNLPIL